MNLLPSINTRGVYTLSEPFAMALVADVAYTCVAIRKLEDIVGAGGDPFDIYYKPKNIEDIKYREDLAAGVCIITLQAPNGGLVYVPSSYITGMPNQGGVVYRTMVLGISLAAIPDDLDLSYLKQKLTTTVQDTIGIISTVREAAISLPTTISNEEHNSIEAARTQRIATSSTDYALYLAAAAERDAALLKIQLLETYIRENLAP